jgi:hypothetical protein
VFIVGKPASTAGTSYIYSSGLDLKTYRSSYIDHTAINSDGGTDLYLAAFLDKDYLKTFKMTELPSSILL